MRKSRGVEKREWVTALRAVVLGTVGGSLAVFLTSSRSPGLCFVKGRVSKVDVSCVHLLFAQAQTLAKSLEVDNFPLSQKTDDVVDIWVIGKAENVIIGEAGLLLCCNCERTTYHVKQIGQAAFIHAKTEY